MNRRRKLIIAAMFVAPLLVVGAACTFPDVTYRNGDAATQPGAETGQGTDGPVTNADGPVDTDSPMGDDAGQAQEGSIGDADASSRPEGSTVVEDAAGCEVRCDCDDDGYLKTGCDAAVPGLDTKPVKGLDDCDDLDDQVHPGQVAYFSDIPIAPNTGDWDCNKTIEKGYSELPCPTLVTSCPANNPPKTFTTTVGCGVSAQYYRCVPDNLGCKAEAIDPLHPLPQACR